MRYSLATSRWTTAKAAEPMSDPLLRQWCMLRSIPRQPRRIDAQSLKRQLHSAGFAVSLRTVQRDLVSLSSRLPLVADDAKPQGWSWKSDMPQLDLPTLEPQAALVFYLAEKHLSPLLPASTLDHLRPWFATAQNVLDAQQNELSHWREKVRVLPSGLPLLPPQVDTSVQLAVNLALLHEKQLEVSYCPRQSGVLKNYTLHPLALVVRNQSFYLLATIGDYTDIRQLALHRIQSATLLEESLRHPSDFDLDRYIAEGAFGWQVGNGGPIRLVVKITQAAALTVSERLLDAQQEIQPLDESHVLLRATVSDTKELRVWLLGFGDQLEILEPPTLREEIGRIAQGMATCYSA